MERVTVRIRCLAQENNDSDQGPTFQKHSLQVLKSCILVANMAFLIVLNSNLENIREKITKYTDFCDKNHVTIS